MPAEVRDLRASDRAAWQPLRVGLAHVIVHPSMWTKGRYAP
ncbi:MAG: hypothetical protein WKF94_00740 [Solirubrobacteraceae bacterium]